MSEKKIVVPDEMLEAAECAYRSMENYNPTHATNARHLVLLKAELEAALRWLINQWDTAANTERMPDPRYTNSREQFERFVLQWSRREDIDFVDLLSFFGNRLNERFLAPEPEVPEEIRSLLWSGSKYRPQVDSEHNYKVMEAYLSGQKSKP
jgi:hypothetical protein